MKKCMYLYVLLAFMLGACSNDPKEDPITPPNYGTVLTVFSLPDSVKVETSAELKFIVSQEDHPEDFIVSIDTVMPFYWLQKIYYENGEISLTDKRFGSANIQVNGLDFKSFTNVKAGKENILSFSNPTAVGEYKIILKITDKYERTEKKEIVLKVWAPEITIKFYNYFAGYNENQYYEELNNKFTSNPLSGELKGLRCDTIYTREVPKHGHPGEWTIPGQGIIFHLCQEGDEKMQFFTSGYSGLLPGKEGHLTTTDFANRIDGKESFGHRGIDQGFHGIMFETSTLTKVGSFYYTLRLVDKWGQEKLTTIVYKAFDRDDTIPEYCTPSENMWWAHYITD